MTKRTTTGVLLVIGALIAAACGDGVLPSGPDFDAQFAHAGNHASKVEVCHKGKLISVNSNAVAAHVGHGDVEGSCEASIRVDDSVLMGPLLTVHFTSTNCSLGNSVPYRLVDKNFAPLGFFAISYSNDGVSHPLQAVPVSPTDAPFRVRGDCTDVGETFSDPFTPPTP